MTSSAFHDQLSSQLWSPVPDWMLDILEAGHFLLVNSQREGNQEVDSRDSHTGQAPFSGLLLSSLNLLDPKLSSLPGLCGALLCHYVLSPLTPLITVNMATVQLGSGGARL